MEQRYKKRYPVDDVEKTVQVKIKSNQTYLTKVPFQIH